MKIEQIKLGLEDALQKLGEQKTETSQGAAPGFHSGVRNVSDWKLDRAIAAVEEMQKLANAK